MRIDVDPDLSHGLHGKRMHIPGRMGSRALDVQNIAGQGAENALTHVAAARVAGAEDEGGGFYQQA